MSKGESAIIKIGEVAKMMCMNIRTVRTLVNNGTLQTLPSDGETRLFSRKYIQRVVDGKAEICPKCGEKI